MRLRSLMIAAVLIALPGVTSASVTYNLTLTDSANATYDGTGSITLASAPSASGLSAYGPGQYSGLTFTVDGQTFTAPPGAVSAVEFLNGAFYDISFAEQIGTSPNRYALDTTGNYVFYFNNLANSAAGTITSSLAVPEPSTWMMMIAGLGAVGALARRRARGRARAGALA